MDRGGGHLQRDMGEWLTEWGWMSQGMFVSAMIGLRITRHKQGQLNEGSGIQGMYMRFNLFCKRRLQRRFSNLKCVRIGQLDNVRWGGTLAFL
jgi:hypothetical protein